MGRNARLIYCLFAFQIAMFAGCSSEDDEQDMKQMSDAEREQVAEVGRREIEARRKQEFSTLTSESLLLSSTDSAPQIPVTVSGIVHTTHEGLFTENRRLYVRFMDPNGIIANEGGLEMTDLGGGRYKYETQLDSPAFPGDFDTEICYPGGHVLTSTPFTVN